MFELSSKKDAEAILSVLKWTLVRIGIVFIALGRKA